jgi:hypothetical protein
VIIVRKVEIVKHVSIEYNEYVPLTLMWRNASEVLESPVYVVWRDENGHLELKFHPSTGILVEVVLAAAPGLMVEQMSLSPINSEDASLMPFLDSSDVVPETGSPLVIKAYLDYLYVSFCPGADRWAGSGPVLFGLAGEQNLAAVCARWTGSERESVLAGQWTRMQCHLP